ncbi:hypothetical protein Agub_g15666 [Astrephomene gubernaculifera]|uniref:TRP C-terminal domain-containing protein n=1 Tax=Astrephomene gubernaculifera TaxID=47775 RepID=A0AAD3E5B1_9CHLO|nr:hypothetical protein Agub_g15666 [Astrephomene gubernaculifera]
MPFSQGPELSITNCTLRSNTAADEHGGSVHTTSVPLSLRGSRLAASTAKQMGGAVFSSAAEYITVSDCILEDNHAGGSGGGLRVEGASLVMVNGSTAKGNSAFETGGGLDLLNTACSYISGVVLEDNTAASGGGARMAMPALTGQSLAATGLSCQAAFSQQVGEEWAARLSRVSERIVEQQGEAVVLVAANLVATNNQALRGVGGTLLLETTRGSIILDALRAGGNIAASTGAAVAFINTVAEDAALYVMSSWLYDNKAAGIGGAISMDGSWSQQQMFISNTTFQRNRAASGGAVSLTRNASLALQDCTLEDNTAAGSSAGDSGDGSGGSLYGESCNWMMLKDTTIRTSSAVRGHGGGLYCSGCGGVVLHNASLVLNDAAGSGGAAYVDASTATGPSLVEVLGGTMRLNTAGSNGSSTAVASDGNLLSGSGGALYLGGRLAAVLNGSRLVGNTAARAAGALALDLRFRQDTSGSSDVVSSSPRLFPLLGSSSIASSSLTSPAASLAVSMSSLRPGLAEIAAASALTLQALAGAVGRSVASDCWPIVINRPALWNNTAGGSGGALYSSSAYTLALLCDGVQTSGSDSDLAWMVNAITSNSSPGTVPAGAVQLATTATGSISSSTGDSDTSNNAGSNTTSDLYLGMLPTSQEARTKCFVPQQDQEFYAERVPPNQARGGYGNEMATTPKMLILSALAEYERTALTSYSANKIKVVDSSDPTRIVVYSRLLLQATTQDREGGYANTSATATTAVFNPPPSLPPAASASSSSVASSTSTGSTAVAVSSEDFVWLRRAVLQVDGHLAEECRPGQRCAVVLPTNVAVALDISVYDALTQLVNDSSTVQPVVRVSVSSSDAGRPVDLLGNPTAQVDGGIATLTGIRLRALKGEYSLQLGLSNMETEVDPLVLNVTVPPCSLGEVAMDSGFFCSRCPANLLSLDVDYFTNASGGGAAIGLFGEAANTSDTGTSTDGRCFACPDNANCTGGAVVAPVPGYWHSAANSTAMHACLNPAACRYGDITANAALVRCQERWYAYFGNPWRLYALMSDGNGGADVVGAYINVFRQAASNATSVQPYTPLISNSSSDFDGFLLDCALWGLPDNDSASYMQMQCAPGYTGILCATCTDYDESRYALDSDFRCNPCYSKWLTILVGVAVFIANTLWLSFSAIMTHMTDYSKQMQKQGAQRSVRRSVKDLITGRISNGTIYYPGEEERRGKKGLAAADILKVLIVHFQFFLIVTRINLNWPDSVTGLQSVVGSITGTVKQVYSPSCLLRPGSDSAEQARMQVLPGLLLPACSVLLVLVLWFLRARFWMSGKHAPSSVDGEPRIWGTLSLKRSIESQPSLKDDAAVRGPRETEGSEGGAPAVERPTGHHGRKGLKDAGSAVAANTRKIYFANERERIRQGPEGSSGKATAGAAAAAADEFPVIEGDGMAIVQTAATVANRGARGTRRALSSKPYGLGAGPRDVRSLLAGTTSLTATTAEALAHVEVLMDQPVNPLFGSRASVVTSSPRASLAVVAAAAMRRLSSVARNRTRELWRPLAPATSGSISTAPGPVAEGTSPPLQPATSNRHPNPLYNERTTPALEGTLSAACSICPEIVDILEYNTGDGKQEPYDNEAAVIPAARWWQPRRLSRGGSLAGCRSSITSNIYSSSVGSTEKPGAGKGHAIGQSVDAARSNGAAVQQDTSAAKGIGSGPEKGARRRSQRLIAVGASSKALVGAAGGKASFRRKKPTAVQPVSVGGPDEGKLPLGKQLFLVLMVTCFIMMPNWATEALSIFACYRLDDGQVGSGMSESYVQFQRATWKYGYWIRDMNQQCYAGQHLTLWVPIGVVSVVLLCLTMPLLTAGLLFANRKQLMTQPQVRQLYGFLFSSYHDKFYYWESLSQAQTLVLVVVEVFGRTLPVYQQALLLEIILLAILLLNTYFSPLRAAELNLMQLLSLAVICMTVTLGMFTSSPVDNVSEASDIILGVVILLINCLIILAFLALFIYHALPTVKRKATRLITRLGYDPAHLEQSLSRALTNLSPSRAWSSLSMPRAWTSLSHTRSRGRDIGLPVQFEDDGIGGGGDTGEAVDNGRNGGVGGHGSNAV